MVRETKQLSTEFIEIQHDASRFDKLGPLLFYGHELMKKSR